jgi:hypothetical protein
MDNEGLLNLTECFVFGQILGHNLTNTKKRSHRWEDNIEIDLKQVGLQVVDMVMKFWVQ